MNEDDWMIRFEKATEDNYNNFGFMLARVQDIVDVINQARKPTEQLIVTDPGNRYCAVATRNQALILWFVDLKDGSIVGATNGIPGGQTKYNIWQEDPTHCMSLMGVINGLRGVPFETVRSSYYPEFLSQEYHHEPCDKSKKVYTNYALEA
jgi:hypothetical protein